MRYEKRQAKQYARENMRGIWAAIMTPFKANGDIDEPEMRRNVRYYVDQLKIDGIFCGGLVGECWSLTMEERLRVHEIVVAEIAGRIPVMPHVGCNSIRDAVRLAQHAQKIGATYLVCVNPPLNPHSTEQLKDWFGSVCAETDLGLCLFNAKESGLSMTPEQIATLAEIENVIGVKNPQPIEHLDEVRRLVGKTIRVFDPAEFRFLDNVRKHGDTCYMSSPTPLLIQTPGRLTFRDYAHMAWNGDLDGAAKLAATLEPVRKVLTKWIGDPWLEGALPLAQVKAFGEVIGFCNGNVRLPLRPLTAAQKAELRADIDHSGLLASRKAA
jgi:4-hydroxy-tetrahydrodipicolinate synthase